jgi:hypothetical protein
VSPDRYIGGSLSNKPNSLSVRVAPLPWSPTPEQQRKLEADAPIGQSFLIGITKIDADDVDARISTSRAVYRIDGQKLVPLMDLQINEQWLRSEGVHSLDQAISKIEEAREACIAARNCVIGISPAGEKVLGAWPMASQWS